METGQPSAPVDQATTAADGGTSPGDLGLLATGHASESMLRAALEAMTDAVFISDLAGRFVLFNDAFVAFHRFPCRAACVQTLAEYPALIEVSLSSGDVVPLEQWAVPRALRGEVAVNQEYHLRRKDTGESWIGSYNLAPVRDGSGRIIGAVVIGRDVTRQKAISDALQASEARYRGLAEQLPEGIFVLDGAGRVLDANQAACRMFRYGLADLRERMLHDLLVFGDTAPALLPRADAGGLVQDERSCRRSDGSTFLGEVLALRLPDGRWQGVVRDITERRWAAQAIRSLEAQHQSDASVLHALFATAPQAILGVDEHGVIRSANPAVEKTFGWLPDQLLGKPCSTLVPSGPVNGQTPCLSSFWNAPDVNDEGRELIAARKDGSQVPVEVRSAVVQTQDGRLVFAFVSDISTRWREEAARKAQAVTLELYNQRLRVLTTELTLAEQHAREGLSRTLHDGVQQLLFGVKLGLDRVARRVDGAQGLNRDALETARQDLDEAIGSVRSLAIELAPPAFRQDGLRPMLEWLVDWMKHKHGLEVALTVGEDADLQARDLRTLVFISVRELLFNCAKHAQVGRAAVAVVRVPGDQLQITVTDGGKGFDTALVASPSRSAPGLGLLSIRERLLLVGGTLDVRSTRGAGSAVQITVPAGTAPQSVTARS
ncbi:hypothetical protein TBR22_A17960 [Luteitalea sp. TBR-22]|uniref:PAS domain-containing sensor histidine kinase n=1 Tax=Luteitalea sp. TBR-22 TaxID=2802971 RepID=UPI001AFA16DC|nr:PAS domain S-box protein [Luteitalea sp. TBR-22]BCS32582.1 hypothetical protein TBR22_A17960 [Luteitalea sp. TBR-22]